MPAKSKAQARLMNAVAHSATFAKKVGIDQAVGNEFAAAGTQYKSLPNRKRNGKANSKSKTKASKK